MSARRYSIQIDHGEYVAIASEPFRDPRGEWVRAEDHERERRRLVVLALKLRASLAYHKGKRAAQLVNDARFAALGNIYMQSLRTVDAIERGDRLDYFARLGGGQGR